MDRHTVEPMATGFIGHIILVAELHSQPVDCSLVTENYLLSLKCRIVPAWVTNVLCQVKWCWQNAIEQEQWHSSRCFYCAFNAWFYWFSLL